MTRSFRFWPQTSTRVTFDPFWANKNFRKLAEIGYFDSFQQFLFFKQGIKCYLIWILRLGLESSRNLESFSTPFCTICTFWLFASHGIIWPQMRTWARSFLYKMQILMSWSWSPLKMHQIRWGKTMRFQKKESTNRTTLMNSPPFPPLHRAVGVRAGLAS